jgi:hypothetical protein
VNGNQREAVGDPWIVNHDTSLAATTLAHRMRQSRRGFVRHGCRDEQTAMAQTDMGEDAGDDMTETADG